MSGDRTRIRIGRSAMAAAMAGTVVGVVTLGALGRWSVFIDDSILAVALITIGFGFLVSVMLPVQPRNGAIWALAWTAFLGGLFIVGRTVQTWEGRGLTDAEIERLTPSDFSFLSAFGMWFGSWPGILVFFVPLTLGMLLFPDGRPPGPTWRAVGWGAAGAMAVMVAPVIWVSNPWSTYTYEFEGQTSTQPEIVSQLFGIGYLASVLFSFASLCALSVRYRRVDSVMRRQIRPVIVGFIGFVLCASGSAIVDALTDGGLNRGAELLDRLLLLLGALFIVASFSVAILKFRLYDLDVVISKTLTYLSLAAFIAAVYIGLVVGISGLIGGRSSFGLSIAASVVVAMAFQPARRRIERWANRVIYGERATPYEVLVRFSHRSAELSDEELLLRVPRLIVEGTAASSASLWSRTKEGFRTAATWPENPDRRFLDAGADFTDPDADHSIGVLHDGEVLGGLSLVTAVGDRVTPVEEELLADLASGLGLALRNARLTGQLRRQVAELEASRERVLAAADEARRTLENDLDSGPQQQLVALKVKLGPTRKLAERAGAEKTAALLAQLDEDAGSAIKSVRDFAGGIYPPLLEAEGLAAAIAQEVNKAAIPVSVRGDGVQRYPREVEAAVYFSVLEALQNTAKYARATSASVALAVSNGSLAFEVSDDGQGFDPATTANGAGLTGMADRLDTVGGELRIESSPGMGTIVAGSVPVQELVGV